MKKYYNYFTLICIYIFTILIVFYFSSLYKKSLGIIGDQNLLDLGMTEINESNYDNLHKNISNYSIENTNFILYLTYSKNDFFSFENELKKIIIDYNLGNNFVYLDTNSLQNYSEINKLIKDFSTNHEDINLSKKDLPLFLYFNNGNIQDIIYNCDLDIEKLKNKLLDLGVI